MRKGEQEARGGGAARDGATTDEGQTPVRRGWCEQLLEYGDTTVRLVLLLTVRRGDHAQITHNQHDDQRTKGLHIRPPRANLQDRCGAQSKDESSRGARQPINAWD